MSEVKVSIFCLAYNHERYIEDTLKGFVKQKTTFDYEVIIHDDASTDNTANIIKEYEAKYPNIIKPIYQIENQYSKGVNIFEKYMAPLAKGKYTALCEGDDFWTDDYKLQKQYDALENNQNCVICVSKVQLCENDKRLINSYIPDNRLSINKTGIITKKEVISFLFGKRAYERYPFHTSSYFFRKFDASEFDIRLDRDLLVMFATKGDFYYIDEIMSNYRQNVNGSYMNLTYKDVNRRVKMDLDFFKGNIIFDSITNHEYHDIIYKGLCSRIANIPKINDDVKVFMKENNITLKTIKKYAGIKESILYLLNRYANFIYKNIKKIAIK